MDFKLIQWGSEEYSNMVALRDMVLRKPLGLHFTPEYLNEEQNNILIGCFEQEKLIGCCILRTISEDTVQLKQMAVDPDRQKTGLGSKIVAFAEARARNIGHQKIFMHARKEALSFYQKLEYKEMGEEFEEVGIPHVMMIKELSN